MTGKRKQRTAALKAQVAVAALKGDRTVNELAGHYPELRRVCAVIAVCRLHQTSWRKQPKNTLLLALEFRQTGL